MSDDHFEPPEISHFIYAADPGVHDGFYGVMTDYVETDAMNAVGGIYRFFPEDDGEVSFEESLSTNDGLDNIAASPDGNLWVGSVWGRVWTTADVPWNPDDIADLDWSENDPRFRWKATALPPDPKGGGFNVAAMWCGSDRDVHAGTFEEVLLHWDGASWRFAHRRNKRPIIRMHGSGPN